MRHRTSRAGVTLVELVITVAIMGMITAAAAAILQTSLQAQTYAETRQNLHLEAYQIMTRIVTSLRDTTHPMLPNGRRTSASLLIFSANINQDDDYYRDNPMLPRVDEDLSRDMTADGAPGVAGVDDDGDLLVDITLDLLTSTFNDDEDLFADEDRWDGIDNDGDGSIDEDVSADMTADGAPGIAGLDDDWDGLVDEGNSNDDDEDGLVNEDPVDPLIYTYNSASKTLSENNVTLGTNITLSSQVSAFSALYEPEGADHGPRYRITLALTANGETVTLTEYVFPRNLVQRTGRKLQ